MANTVNKPILAENIVMPEPEDKQPLEVKLPAEPPSVDELNSKFKKLSAEKIVNAVASFYGFTPQQLKQRKRTKDLAFTRQIAAYLLRECNMLSYPDIGHHLGSRDHSTIIHAHRKVKAVLEKSPELRRQLGDILESIGQKLIIEKSSVPAIESLLDQTEEGQTQETFEIKSRKHALYNAPPETIAREKKILSRYRSGMTLEEVGREFKVTRERIRQIVLKAIFREIEERRSEGFEIDEEEYLRQEKMRHGSKPINTAVNDSKQKRWSRYYSRCRKCGTTSIPHIRHGLCEQCAGNIRDSRREILIASKHGRCEDCDMTRAEAKIKFGRDFYLAKISRVRKVLCKGCFLNVTSKRMLESRWGRSF